jgi:hypothetical protein
MCLPGSIFFTLLDDFLYRRVRIRENPDKFEKYSRATELYSVNSEAESRKILNPNFFKQ